MNLLKTKTEPKRLSKKKQKCKKNYAHYDNSCLHCSYRMYVLLRSSKLKSVYQQNSDCINRRNQPYRCRSWRLGCCKPH